MATAERLEDLVDDPQESLDVELKSWLDLRDESDRANLAHALLALANHGGGFVVLGFKEEGGEWVRAPGKPLDDTKYSQDTVNEIVKKYADPAFHCAAHRIARGEGVTHLVVTVPGGHKVPVRARAGGPENKHVKKDTYYIRRPGPESAPPQSAAEWDALLRRCLQASKDEIADLVRGALAGSLPSEPTTSARLTEWVTSCDARLAHLVTENLPDERPSRYARGAWSFAYALDPPIALTIKSLDEALRKTAEVHVTGWPTFLVMSRDDFAPYPTEHAVETWIHEPGTQRDAAHSDFWRASPDGRLFLLRGYQEDSEVKGVEQGSALDKGLPVWRIGECLLHLQRFAQHVDRGDARAVVQARWTGLAGRRLGDLVGDWRTGPEGRPCRQERVIVEATVDVATIRAGLGKLVAEITAPLYSAFDFYALPERRIETELRRLLPRG